MKLHAFTLAIRCSLALAVSAAFAGCQPEQPADGAAAGLREAPRAQPNGAAALEEQQVVDFVTLLERLLHEAVERTLAQGSGSDAAQRRPLVAAPERRVPDDEPLEREFDVRAPGATGNVRSHGLAFTRPWPARYEMSLELDGFSAQPELAALGAVQYNLVRDDRAVPPEHHGLFRANLTLAGSYAGDVDLHGEIAAGKIVSLVVRTGRERFAFGGREPRPLVSYVATLAGTGERGYGDGAARTARFNEPVGIVVDRNGRAFIADAGNRAVRELSPNGEVSTLSTAFERPQDLAFDGLGLLVVSDGAASTAEGFGPISRVVTGGELKGTVVRTIRRAGNNAGFPLCSQYSCDGRSPLAQMQWARGIDVRGSIVTVAQWALPIGLRMVTPDGMTMTLRTWGQAGTSCNAETALGGPHDVAWGPRGRLYFTTDCNAVWEVLPDGTLRPLAGTPSTALGFADGTGGAAKFSYPAGLVTDGRFLYLTESSGSLLRRVDPLTGDTLRLAGCLEHTPGFDCVDSVGFRDGPGDYALFNLPANLALDPWGDLYVADTGNNAIRFVRLVRDPERRPAIDRVQPLALQRGAEATLTVDGRDLGLAREVDLGSGVTAEIVERGATRLTLRARVADDAPSGAHALAITTPFGRTSAPDGMAVNVIAQSASRAQVRTIAGTGSWSVGINDIVPAEQAQLAFPAGLAAIDHERLLVADPLEQRVRMIATKDGAALELLDLAAYEAGGQLGLAILQGIEGFEKISGDLLGLFGMDNFTEVPREELLDAIGAGLDAICEAASSDCSYMALPWAGMAAAPGDSGGFRLSARLFLPTDVAVIADQQFLIADTGNARLKAVGVDFWGTEPKPAPYQAAGTRRVDSYPFAVAALGADTAVAATSTLATLAKVTLRDGSTTLSGFAGVRQSYRCARREDDVRHPLGVPTGIARGRSGTFVADPYCKTIWRLDDNGEVEDIRGELKVDLSPLPPCSDGPLVFATFSAPMDVAVDSAGNIWVADAGCHSIRVIKDRLGGSVDDAVATLAPWARTMTPWLESAARTSVERMLASANLGDLQAARWWVVTVAGGPDAEPGFRDGAASEALFNAPVSLAVAEDDGKTYVFVSDAGNKRIRLIEM